MIGCLWYISKFTPENGTERNYTCTLERELLHKTRLATYHWLDVSVLSAVPESMHPINKRASPDVCHRCHLALHLPLMRDRGAWSRLEHATAQTSGCRVCRASDMGVQAAGGRAPRHFGRRCSTGPWALAPPHPAAATAGEHHRGPSAGNISFFASEAVASLMELQQSRCCFPTPTHELVVFKKSGMYRVLPQQSTAALAPSIVKLR